MLLTLAGIGCPHCGALDDLQVVGKPVRISCGSCGSPINQDDARIAIGSWGIIIEVLDAAKMVAQANASTRKPRAPRKPKAEAPAPPVLSLAV